MQAFEEYQGTAVYRSTRCRASDAPSQSTTNTDHYLEIVELQSLNEQDSTTADADHYDVPDVEYEGLDLSTVTDRDVTSTSPPVPVYDRLAH